MPSGRKALKKPNSQNAAGPLCVGFIESDEAALAVSD